MMNGAARLPLVSRIYQTKKLLTWWIGGKRSQQMIDDIDQAIKLAEMVGGELLQVEVRRTSVTRCEPEDE